jgi:uncharacterized protein YllA (UPF0747 family)
MIAIPCHNCNHMIDIDTQLIPIEVPCYLLLCRDCQIQSKINERNIKLNKVLNKGLKERIKVWLKS